MAVLSKVETFLGMQPFSAQSVEIGLVAASAVGLLVLLAPAAGRKPKATQQGWLFPVKLSYLLAHWLAFAAGIGLVYLGVRRLLGLGASNWAGWTSFALGFALVLLVLAVWPEPLISDRHGLLERGSPSSRIRWENLSHVRQYQIRMDRGVVIHSVYGKQLVVPELKYASTQILDWLLEHYPVPIHTLQDESAPISIFDAQGVPRTEANWVPETAPEAIRSLARISHEV